MNEPNTKPLPGKTALLRRIETGFEGILAAANALTDQDFERSVSTEWTVKDTLAHIASWEEILLRFHMNGEPFEQVIGLPGARYRETSFEQINAHLQKMTQSLSASEVRRKLHDTHAALLEALAGFPDEQLHQPHPELSTGEAAGLCWIDYIAANTYEHYEEHLPALPNTGS